MATKIYGVKFMDFQKLNFWTFFGGLSQCVTGRKLLEIAGRGRVELEGGSSKGMD